MSCIYQNPCLHLGYPAANQAHHQLMRQIYGNSVSSATIPSDFISQWFWLATAEM